MWQGFTVELDGRLRSDLDGFRLRETEEALGADGGIEEIRRYVDEEGRVDVRLVRVRYPGMNVVRQYAILENGSDAPITLSRFDSIRGVLLPGEYELSYFLSTGGNEFTPARGRLAGTKILESTSGRSARGMSPWFGLTGEGGMAAIAAFAWSGNWIARFEPAVGGAYRVSGGLSDWAFHKTLEPGQSMESAPAIYSVWEQGTLEDVRAELGAWGKRYWYPSGETARSLPVAWNHWWPYEDTAITEDVFKANVDEAAALGIEVCTLDAGWFGEPDESCNAHVGWSDTQPVDWYLKRGDWHKINTKRFPSGIAALSDYVHAKGLKFGIWCEIEALGAKSDLAAQRPELAAMRDGEPAGYVCMGCPASTEWAFGVLETLIRDYRADWIKLDFNLDPGAGCDRTDHGHGEGDGLYEHVRGYYRLLERVREKYPRVILENCSSGGLRIDLGLAKHTHLAFLSDPDYTQHHLQLFWGAASLLHPSAIFHFTWSQNLVFYDNFVDKDPIKPEMPLHKFDYLIRANMLNAFGVSYRLPELEPWARERLGHHIERYKSAVRPFVANAEMRRLTGQTLRTGQGDRWNAFQYTERSRGRALAFVFRLNGGEPTRTIRFAGLRTDATYAVRSEDRGAIGERTGAELMDEGLSFEGLPEEACDLFWFERIDVGA